MNQGMNINFNFNNKNTIQNTPKFNTKSYNLNSDVNYSRLNNNNNTTQNQKFKSVTV